MEEQKKFVLLIDSPDELGLVYKITHPIYSMGYNVVENDEFVDHQSKRFFMRTVFLGSEMPQTLVEYLHSTLPTGARIQLNESKKKDIVILATKEYHCLSDLLIRHHYGDLKANVKAVVSNHAVLGDLVEKFDIPFHHISAEGLEREAHEKLVAEQVKSYSPDYLILAKYMRILTPYFVGEFTDQIINIHHSFLPAFIGANPYKQAFDRGVKIIGATAHFVNNELDEGPIIAQDISHVNHRFTAKAMAKTGRDTEKIVLAKALKLVFEDKVFVHGNKTVIFD